MDDISKNIGYAIYDDDNIWEIISDNQDGTVDISIDDVQGDITVVDVDKDHLTIVGKDEYDKRITEVNRGLNNNHNN